MNSIKKTGILGWSCILLLLIMPRLVQGQAFPGGEGFNGLNISYSVSGASLGTPTDTYNFTTGRDYKDGRLTGNRLSISGTASNSWEATVNLSVTIEDVTNGRRAEFKHEMKGTPSQAFDVALDIFQDSLEVNFSINEAACYGNGECRSLYVAGHLTKPATLTADFSATPLSGPSPLRVQLSDLSTGGKVTAWQWEIPGTTWTSTVQHPVVVLSTKNKDGWKVGVKLTVRAGALSSSKTKTNYIIVSPDNVAPALNSKVSAKVVGSRVVVSGVSSDAGGVSQVVYCVNKCKSYKKATGTTKWKIRIPKGLFGNRGKLSLKIWAQDAAGNWSTPLSKTLVMG